MTRPRTADFRPCITILVLAFSLFLPRVTMAQGPSADGEATQIVRQVEEPDEDVGRTVGRNVLIATAVASGALVILSGVLFYQSATACNPHDEDCWVGEFLYGMSGTFVGAIGLVGAVGSTIGLAVLSADDNADRPAPAPEPTLVNSTNSPRAIKLSVGFRF